ncbi:MAG: HAMP domain-containing sensor histidine kinase [Myxococcota bacterium]
MDSSPVRRRLLLWIVGASFVVMASIAAWRVVSLRDLAVQRERSRLEEFVKDQVEGWEDELLKTLQDRLVGASADPDQERLVAMQRQFRRAPWFDSVFVWEPPSAGQPGVPVFPTVSVPDADEQVRLSPCMRAFGELSRPPYPEVDVLVRALVYGCRAEPPNVRLTATTNAAILLLGVNRYEDALRVLGTAMIPDNLTLRAAGQQGVSPFRLAAWRTLQVDVLLALNRPGEGLDLAVRVGEQIADLDAPDLPPLLHHMRRIVDRLEQHGRLVDAARLSEGMSRADRRKHAYEEVLRRLSGEPLSGSTDARFVYDVYSDQPFLLYYGWSNGHGVAFALEQHPLIEAFLQRMRKLQGAVTLTEARSDRWVAGARSGGSYAIVVPFTRTLTNLRVCIRQSVVDAATNSINEEWYMPLFVILACVVFGIGGLIAVDRATLREVELSLRQRAFATRVTHELKTPLAGIKVMAENLEVGAFRDDAHRREMAGRIVAEADNLTRRVDEVLAVARQRTIPKPEPVDPEEVLLMAVDDWGPRLHDAGVALRADLAVTDPVLGDGNALRDAVACLLDNALKYRREDRPEPSVWLTLEQVGRQVVIAVADNGLGVPRPMRKRVFDRFVRVEGPHRGKAGGHGLGLHQVREIVAAHHGTVTCADGVDGGAKFVIRLPALRS